MSGSQKAMQFARSGGWKGMGENSHFVQFYDDDTVLLDSVCGFIGGGLIAGAACVVIATPEHVRGLEQQLIDRGFDLDSARRWKQYSTLDAADTLATFMVDGMPDPDRFAAVVGNVIAGADAAHPRVLAFGEMVGLLWSEGNHAAAIELEKLWNALVKRYGCSLFCAYPANDTDRHEHAQALADVCAEHSGVIHANRSAESPDAGSLSQ